MVIVCDKCGSVIPPNYEDMPHLTPREHAVYTFVAKHPGCTIDYIVDHIYREDPNGGPMKAHNTILCFITYINNKLRKANVDHRIVNFSKGYPARYRLAPALKGTPNADLNLPTVLPGL